MNSGSIMIIAFDSMDYDVVNQGHFPHLKQKEYGKVEIEFAKEINDLKTPIIWASFITGKQPSDHGVTEPVKLKWKNLEGLMRLSQKIGLHRSEIIYHALLNLGTKTWRYTKRNFKKKGIKTIFDFAPSRVISLPSYNEEIINAELKELLKRALSDSRWKAQLKRGAFAVFYKKKQEVLAYLENIDWSILMVHFFITDLIQHCFFFNETVINDLYNVMDETVKEISAKTPANCWILIISDHGQKRGLHTKDAFYSSNQILGLKSPKITDFYSLVKKKIFSNSKIQSEREKIKEHLKSLGYF